MKYNKVKDQQLQYDVEHGEINPVSPSEKKRLKEKISAGRKNRQVNIRLPEEDLAAIRDRAEKAGLPYQTLIGVVLHQYAKGDIEVII